MAAPLTVLITGAGRGIGFALTQIYLLRPNTTVIASTRNSSPSPALAALPSGPGSKLLHITIESTSPTSAQTALSSLPITHLDIVLANAGISPPIAPLSTVPLTDMLTAFQINALGPLALFQATRPLLQISRTPKWVVISSAAGSLGGMEGFGSHVAPAYCVSKVGANWIVLAAHCGDEWLCAFAVSPGLVATDMGNRTAKMMGLEKAPYTQEFSAGLIVKLIDKADRENTSGKFINVINGEEIPW